MTYEYESSFLSSFAFEDLYRAPGCFRLRTGGGRLRSRGRYDGVTNAFGKEREITQRVAVGSIVLLASHGTNDDKT